jgi:glycerol-3-phosphate dehydrogenase
MTASNSRQSASDEQAGGATPLEGSAPRLDTPRRIADSRDRVPFHRETAEPYDLAVIGGGITGAGIARDAALRGMRVLLVEKRDFGAGTSSKSSKMIHGGLRYLEHGAIGLVFESLSERSVQSRVAPHLVRPMTFQIPIYKGLRPGLELMNVGLWIYDVLSLFRAPRLHRTYRGARARAVEPRLKEEGLRGVLEYHDCVTDDFRLVLENAIDAGALGATCLSHTEALAVTRDRRGDVRALRVVDQLSGEEKMFPIRAVAVAAGPWTEIVAERVGLDAPRPLLRPTKGVHLVFPRDVLPLERAITMISPIDGRVMFALPWRDRTVLGTTDTDFHGSPDDVYADADDARYLCESANAFFPGADFSPERVISTWAGLRPLVDDRAARESEVSREHQIFTDEHGAFAIAGGKLTTYRLMAREVVDVALQWIRDKGTDAFAGRPLRRIDSRRRPLPGARGLDAPSWVAIDRLATELTSRYGLDGETARHLAGVYGERARAHAELIAADPALGDRLDAELPFVWSEIGFAADHDLARTVEDVLARRVPLLLVSRDQGEAVVERVADTLAQRLGWSREARRASIATYLEEVERSRRFRDPAPARDQATARSKLAN